MTSSLDVIERSKKKIASSYFKITKKDDAYQIKQYFGPKYSLSTMMTKGWNIHSYLSNFITDEYPVFNLEDFISDDGIKIRKKTSNEKIKETLKEYVEYYKLNENLAKTIKKLKTFILSIGVNFNDFSSFDSLSKSIFIKINNLNISQIDKANLITEFNDLRIQTFEMLETVGIERCHLFFNDSFKMFFILVE